MHKYSEKQLELIELMDYTKRTKGVSGIIYINGHNFNTLNLVTNVTYNGNGYYMVEYIPHLNGYKIISTKLDGRTVNSLLVKKVFILHQYNGINYYK